MAAPQNSRSGSTPKTHRRSRPPIQTCDPDRSRPHDPDLWSRPLASFCLGLLIQTLCFILEWTCWILPHPFPYRWTVALKDMLSSCLLRLACYSCLACSLLLATAQLEHFGSRPVTKIWSKSAYPVPDLVPHRSRPVPDCSRSFPHRSMEWNLVEEEVSGQCKTFWFFLSRIHTDYHDSIHSVPDVRNRRFTKVAVPDVRITAERSRPVYWCIAICLCLSKHQYRDAAGATANIRKLPALLWLQSRFTQPKDHKCQKKQPLKLSAHWRRFPKDLSGSIYLMIFWHIMKRSFTPPKKVNLRYSSKD